MAERGIQTERAIEYSDRGTECLRQPSRFTQTTADDVAAGRNLIETGSLRINPEVVEIILAALNACEVEEHLFQALDEFRRDDAIELIRVRSADIPEAERDTVVDIVGGGNFRVAVLFGAPHHDSWCEHVDSGRALVFQRFRFAASPIRLPNCPNTALFDVDNHLIIGTSSGELIFCSEDGEIFWQNAKVHTRAVTALRWLRRDVLLSCGLDGRVTLSSVAVAGLESLRQIDVTVGNLPRGLRPANSAVFGQAVGIVDANVSDDGEEIFLVGETGALWSIDAKNLFLQTLGFEEGGVKCFQLFVSSQKSSRSFGSELLVLQTFTGAIKLKPRKGLTTQQLNIYENGQSSTTFVLKSSDNLLVCALDGGEIVGIDLTTRRTVLRQPRSNAEIVAMILCSGDRTLVVLTDDFKLNFFSFSTEL